MMKLTDITVRVSRYISKGSLFLLFLLFPLSLFVATSCSFGGSSSAADAYQPIRSPYPTFTPTPVGVAQADIQNTPAAPAPAAENAEPINTPLPPATENDVAANDAAGDDAVEDDAATVSTDPSTVEVAPAPVPPRLVVNSPLVNVRTGPSTNYNVLTTVERGQEYDIIGKNAAGDWWRFCCIDGNPAWIISELVDVDGAVELAPVVDEAAATVPTDTPAAAVVAATQAPPQPATEPVAEEPTQPPPAPELAFELVSAEQFSEPKVVRVFLYVYDGEEALAGYTIHVKKDGADQTVNGTSSGQPGFTWPIANTRQRFQNMKVEFPNVTASGVWEIQLVDGGGNAVGPITTFTLTANDANQELYVRYKKR